ncbi:MAG: threonine synthase [Akkermansiaceae bacterium]|nr:threonine synthase [Akkermansiaceae bacterium]MDG1070129.1 threonine synthase [Akkermansiaceae bacterium]MDG1670463.1 threonine synthase [Akkermansiaceae bacterium]MDG2322733.1 threonine synthase [Akkermansiaceae bacterium]
MSQRFYSTKSPGDFVDVKEAVLRSLPADNGLYMPEKIEPLGDDFWNGWRDLSLSQLGFRIARQVFRESIPADQLEMIVHEAINFPAPLVTVKEKEYVLELYHGPTLAFKDFGARFMARLMRWLTRDDDGLLTVLVATSGDTGGAVASAFHKVPGTRVIILYPKGKVSGLQEKQLTTLGDNITALEIEGTFDDCQRLVKSAFLKREMSERMNLTSANSINISRLVPQSFYYFDAARNLPEGAKPTFVIPSGNFGNLTAGLFAEEMGLPVEQFVAATNRNDVVPVYLKEGEYRPRSSVATISNAMDVGAPSNFARMESIFGSEWERMRSRIAGFAYDDEMTRDTIRRVNAETGYTLEPHGAVGWMAAEAWRKDHPEAHTVVLETAHPSKFLDVMEEELGKSAIEIPERLACLADREKVAIQLGTDESAFQDWLEGLE